MFLTSNTTNEEDLYSPILKKIRVLYESHDNIYKKRNLITKIFWQIRKFISDTIALRHAYPIRIQWDLGVWEDLENPKVRTPYHQPDNQNQIEDINDRIERLLSDQNNLTGQDDFTIFAENDPAHQCELSAYEEAS